MCLKISIFKQQIQKQSVNNNVLVLIHFNITGLVFSSECKVPLSLNDVKKPFIQNQFISNLSMK